METEEIIEEARKTLRNFGYCCFKKYEQNKEVKCGFLTSDGNFKLGNIFAVSYNEEDPAFVGKKTIAELLSEGWLVD